MGKTEIRLTKSMGFYRWRFHRPHLLIALFAIVVNDLKV